MSRMFTDQDACPICSKQGEPQEHDDVIDDPEVASYCTYRCPFCGKWWTVQFSADDEIVYDSREE